MWDLKIDTRRLVEGFSTSVLWERPNVLWNKADDWWNDNYVTDPSTAAFLSATGIIDPNKQNYVNNLVIALKNQGLWNKMKAIYPFVSEQRNLLNNTDTFSGWALEGGTLTGDFTDPQGGTTAYKYRNNNVTQGIFAGQGFTITATTYTQSIWVKSVSGANVTFDLGSGNGPTGLITLTATATWQRVTNTTTFDVGGSMYIRNISDTVNGIYIWHPQVELGNLTDYQVTINAQEQFAAAYKYNLKDPQDTDAAFRLKIFGTWTFTPTGATPNGTNAFMDTMLIPSTSLSTSSAHLSFYSRTNKNEATYDLSASQHYSLLLYSNAFAVNLDMGSGYPAQFLVSDTRGYYIGTRLNNTNVDGYRNGIKVINNVAENSTLATQSLRIGSAATGYYSTKQTAFVTAGDGLTDAEALALNTIVQQFQVNWNRAV